MTDILRNAVTEEELFNLVLIPRMLYFPTGLFFYCKQENRSLSTS